MTSELPPDRYVMVGDVNTRFWALGDEGSTLILIHGLGAFAETWIENVIPLAKHHRVFALDLVGFGRSDKPSISYTIEVFARFLRDFMDTQGIETATLIGNSMGGIVALQFALMHPNQVEALVLVSSAGFGYKTPLAMRVVTLPIVGEVLLRPNRKAANWILRGVMYDPDRIPDQIAEVGLELFSAPQARKALLRTLRSILGLGHGGRAGAHAALMESLSGVTAPTLIVWGREDRVLPVAHAYLADQTLPNTTLQVYDRCGHLPQVERAQEFNALLLDFLNKLR